MLLSKLGADGETFTDYSIFNENDLRMSDEDRIKAVCKSKAGLADSNKELWTVVGEWTPANTGKYALMIVSWKV